MPRYCTLKSAVGNGTAGLRPKIIIMLSPDCRRKKIELTINTKRI